jgi:hypothetical protein
VIFDDGGLASLVLVSARGQPPVGVSNRIPVCVGAAREYAAILQLVARRTQKAV